MGRSRYPRRQPQLQAQLPQPRPPLITAAGSQGSGQQQRLILAAAGSQGSGSLADSLISAAAGSQGSGSLADSLSSAAAGSQGSGSGKTEGSDGTSLCLIAAACTLVSSVANFLVILRDDGTNREYCELVTGTMKVAICYPYIFLKLHEFVPNLQPTPAAFAPFKSWIACRLNVRVFRDTAVLVVISYLLLLDINLGFVWLAIFPVIAIVFIRALYMNLYCGTVMDSRKDTARSNVDDGEKTIKKTVELEFIVMFTIGALIVMDQLPCDAAEGFAVSQFLLFLSSTVAALTRMMMKLPADISPGIAPASELLHKTLLLLLLVTAHTVAAEWLGEDVVLVCLPEVVPVLLWFSLHLDGKPGSSSVINVDKMKPHGKDITSSIINVNKMKPHRRDIIDVNKMKKPHGKDMSSVISIDKKMKPHKDIGSIISVDKMRPRRKGLIALGAVVVALLAYLASSMDESGLSSWCTMIMVSCGVSGILTYYLVFMQRHWSWPGQQAAADRSKDDVPSSGMLKLWADALLIAAAALLLLRYLVSLRLGLQQPLQVGKVVHSAEILHDYVSNFLGFNYSK